MLQQIPLSTLPGDVQSLVTALGEVTRSSDRLRWLLLNQLESSGYVTDKDIDCVAVTTDDGIEVMIGRPTN